MLPKTICPSRTNTVILLHRIKKCEKDVMDQQDNQHSNCSSFSSKINEKQIIETTLKEAAVINQKKPPKKQRLKR